MKKWISGTLIGLGVLVVIVTLGAIWQKENIQLIYEGSQYTQEEIQEQEKKNKEEVEKALSQYELMTLRELTEEEKTHLADGKLSIEEAAERLLEPSIQENQDLQEEGEAEVETANASSAAIDNSEDRSSEATPVLSESQATKGEAEIVKMYTAKMYALQSKYMGKLSTVESKGWGLIGRYTSGKSSIKELAPEGMVLVQEALSLQAQCDGEVETILQNLTQELDEIGVNNEVVTTMRSVYESEKRAKKAYYLSLIPKF